MSPEISPVPEGFHRVTPHLVVRNAAEAIEEQATTTSVTSPATPTPMNSSSITSDPPR